jgi:hypothetical protein
MKTLEASGRRYCGISLAHEYGRLFAMPVGVTVIYTTSEHSRGFVEDH